ncbi:solute carrier family 15 member 4-like [Biomphalaria glabrata]|uniref:Solute carrier family 15 member 4-like n=1 Tax=Biomphalaria glabrata TaxID=6526 RepID=A0A9W2ZQI3_BIOGL|nr:solute carrier family 15 member 4-like [Biomphalaria glabrata]
MVSVSPDRDRRKVLVTLSILGTEMCERLAFYSVSANMVLFGTSTLGLDTVDATSISLAFSALANLFPVVGGYISDSWLGRFRTILFSGILNVVAMLFIQCAAIDFHDWFEKDLTQVGKRVVYLVGLFLLTVGTGGLKANISPFGAEQLDSLGKEAVQSFFNWFYWVINIGALVAYAGVAYLQQNVSFTWGLFLPLVVTLLQIILFVLPRNMYTRTRPAGKIWTTSYSPILPPLALSAYSPRSVLVVALKILRQGCCHRPPHPDPKLPEGSERKLFARAKTNFGGSFNDVTVEGLADVISVLPFCLLVIMYYAIYSQTTSSFFVQSERLDVRLGSINVPAAMLNTIGNISIIILIPVIDRLFYPCMKKIGLPLTYLKRIGAGMVLSVVAVVVAGVVEIYRKDVMNQPGGSHVQVLANENFTASSMSVFVQVPQFAIVGASEIFTSVTCLEFAYTQAPASLQGLLTGLFLAAWGIGNLVSMAILLVVERATILDPWYGDEINHVKMENLMFLLAGLMAANFVIFCGVALRFKYKETAPNLNSAEHKDKIEHQTEGTTHKPLEL